MTLSCRRYLRAMTKKKKVLPIFCFDCLKAEWLVTCERVRSTRVWFDRRQAKQMREAGVVYTRRSLLSPSSSSWVSDGRDGHLDVSGELETRETAGWLWTFSLHRSRLWSLLPFWWLSLSLLFLLATRSADGASGRTVNAFWYQNVRQAAGKRVGNSGQSISQGFPFCLSLADLHQNLLASGNWLFIAAWRPAFWTFILQQSRWRGGERERERGKVNTRRVSGRSLSVTCQAALFSAEAANWQRQNPGAYSSNTTERPWSGLSSSLLLLLSRLLLIYLVYNDENESGSFRRGGIESIMKGIMSSTGSSR